MKKIMLYIISIVAFFAWVIPYWIAIPPTVFIPVVCVLCAACIYLEIRLQWLKNKFLTISEVLLLSVFFMLAMAANIEKSGVLISHWIYVMLLCLYAITLVLLIITVVRHFSNQHHKKSRDGTAD